jgi:hypothetical protein
MPGAATAQLLKYAEVVDVDLDQTNDVNFADTEDYGHRVVVEMSTQALNDYLGWYRAVGEARPKAKLNAAAEADFKASIEAALTTGFVDVDGVTGGLHFGSDNLSTNPDERIRKEGSVSANDLPLAFVLYKLYGNSAIATLDKIYNLADAHDMLSNETVSTAITEAFKAAEAGALDTMFRDLLASDPHRFFDASGYPMPGMFETATDVYGSGDWKMVQDDTIEVKIKMMFKSKVTRRGVAGREHNLTATDADAAQENQQTVISPDDYFYVRLQLKAVDGAGGGGDQSGGDGGGGIPGVTVTAVANNGNSTDSEIVGLATAAPITMNSANNYTNEYFPPYHSLVYDYSIDEIQLVGGGPVVMKFESLNATTYSCYFDLYNRGTVDNGQLVLTVAPAP